MIFFQFLLFEEQDINLTNTFSLFTDIAAKSWWPQRDCNHQLDVEYEMKKGTILLKKNIYTYSCEF